MEFYGNLVKTKGLMNCFDWSQKNYATFKKYEEVRDNCLYPW